VSIRKGFSKNIKEGEKKRKNKRKKRKERKGTAFGSLPSQDENLGIFLLKEFNTNRVTQNL
jgi:hypothetical protein